MSGVLPCVCGGVTFTLGPRLVWCDCVWNLILLTWTPVTRIIYKRLSDVHCSTVCLSLRKVTQWAMGLHCQLTGRGVEKFFKTLAIALSQDRKQVKKTTGQKYRKGQWEGKKIPRQTGEWVCNFTRQSLILHAFGELASGYPHPCVRRSGAFGEPTLSWTFIECPVLFWF
jgi:hypothetical protein